MKFGVRFKQLMWIAFTFLVAMMLTIIPQPSWAIYSRPQWVYVVLLFWLVAAPDAIGPVVAWLIGLYVDVLTGVVLGQHAFVFVVTTYFVQRLLRQIQAMPLWQHMLGVGCLSIIYLIISSMFAVWQGVWCWRWMMLLPIPLNMIIWPWLYFLCRDVRQTNGYIITSVT